MRILAKKKISAEKKIEKMLEMLDERLVRGEISESTYNELKAKYSAKMGKISFKIQKPIAIAEEELEEKPAEKPAEKPVERPAPPPAEKPAPKPAEKPPEKPAEKPAPKPSRGRTSWGTCPVCSGEWPAELDACKKCGASALASHKVHKSRSLLALGPSGKKAKGFAHIQYGAKGIGFLLDWLPSSEFSDGVTLIKRYKDGTNDRARFKLKTREWDVHFHKRLTNPEKILDFFAHPSERPAEPAPSKPSKPAGLTCTHCKIELPAGTKFCPNCGRKVEPPKT